MKEGITVTIVSLSLFLGIIFWRDIKGLFTDSESKNKSTKIKKSKKLPDNVTDQVSLPGTVTVKQRWEMPEILTEISGISVIDEKRIACVQDEKGSVFVFNITKGNIEREIPFAGAGDYEGIAWTGESMFVVRADGQLYEIVKPFDGKPSVREFKTGLTLADNVESLGFDKKNNRLLLTGKDEAGSEKEIAAFDLGSRKMVSETVIRIDLSSLSANKKGVKTLQASGLGIHPVSGDIYITEGPKVKLHVLDANGKIMTTHQLDEIEFPQAEGVSFGANGEIFISTEGKKGNGAIVQVEIK